jgi:hypothetical protein
MLTIPNIDLQAHWLPDDAAEAELAYLEVLHSPGDTYIDLFGENWDEYADEIIKADANGVMIDMNIDHDQSTTPTVRPVLAKIVAAFQSTKTGSCLTIVSAPSGHIWHEKSTVCKATDGGEDWCVTGSTNVTAVAFQEGNHLLVFRSNVFAARQIAQHNAIKALCRQKHPEWQLMPLPSAPASTVTIVAT